MSPEVSVLITTKDRRRKLKDALDSVMAQTSSAEIIVIDDGSRDETSTFVSSYYPQVVLLRNERPLGIIGARNQGVAAASGTFVLILDDDAVLISRDTVGRIPKLFDCPKVGVVALPVVDVINGIDLQPEWPAMHSEALSLGTFRAGASAVCRKLFQELGGYRGFGRQGEESDFTLRMLDRGCLVRQGPSDLYVRHYPDRGRISVGRILKAAARNRLLSIWYTAPWILVPVGSVLVILNYLRLAIREGHLAEVVQGFVSAIATAKASETRRDAVRMRTYFLHRRLIRNHGLPISVVSSYLEPRDVRAPE